MNEDTAPEPPPGYRLANPEDYKNPEAMVYRNPAGKWAPRRRDLAGKQFGPIPHYAVPVDTAPPILPTDPESRKAIPLYSGVIKYFPRALAAVAERSREGNDQHNPGTPLHWDRAKSGDELDALMRHLIDQDWTAVAWRALAHLEKELEKGGGE